MTDWRPISTAPQTGEHILLFYPDSRDLPVRIGRWLSDFPASRWYSYSGPIHRRLERGPTHWMPLPPPPRPFDPAPAPLTRSATAQSWRHCAANPAGGACRMTVIASRCDWCSKDVAGELACNIWPKG
jgi:hypothetical protein